MKFLLKFLFLSLIITSCSQEDAIFDEYAEPAVYIKSITITSSNAGTVVLSVNKGINTEVKNIRLVLDNQTTNMPSKIIDIPISDKRVEDQIVKIKIDEKNNTFFIKAELETEKNVYTSDIKTLDFSKSDAYLSMGSTAQIIEAYTPGDVKTYAVLKKDSISVYLNTQNIDFKAENIRFLLDGKIPVRATFYPNYNYFDIFISEDVEPGDYRIHFYTDELDLISNFKILVLEGQVNLFDRTYQDKRFDNLSWFILNDNINFIGRNDVYSQTPPSFRNWNLNMSTKKWNQKPDFIFNNELYINIISTNLKVDNTGFVLVQKQNEPLNVKIFSYSAANDKWDLITTYPNGEETPSISFTIDKKIYVGGGRPPYNMGFTQNPSRNFWEYDSQNKHWTKKKNIPFDGDPIHAVCNSDKNAYVLTSEKELWEYDPDIDTWNLKIVFPKTSENSYIRSSMVYMNEKIYFFSILRYGRDIMEYDIRTNKWKLNTLLPFFINPNVPFFAYQNKLYLGYTEDFSTRYANIYEIIP